MTGLDWLYLAAYVAGFGTAAAAHGQPRWSDPPPSKPWCRWCLDVLARQARDVGLLP